MNGQNVGRIVVNTRYANSASPTAEANIAVLSDGNVLDSFAVSEGKGVSKALQVGDYTLNITANGFFDTVISNINVSDGVDTVATVQLFPLYYSQKEDQYER
ncbi:MAG: carboxypeptidase regulatory-like domain-containing protein [Clostridia bacterium]|nr:carboxypeptidase regulatory-like domain-containing protein [Clostridia bacterium]